MVFYKSFILTLYFSVCFSYGSLKIEIPNIQKQRKHLAKLVLDMDSSRARWDAQIFMQWIISFSRRDTPALMMSFSSLNCRWHQSSKSSTLSNKETSTGAKADALREEMEEAANRVEICRVGGTYFSLSFCTANVVSV